MQLQRPAVAVKQEQNEIVDEAAVKVVEITSKNCAKKYKIEK